MPIDLLFVLLRFAVIIAILFFGQWRRWPLEVTLLLAALFLSASYGQGPREFASIAFDGCCDNALFAIMAALFSMLALSSVLDTTGQTKRLADAARGYITSVKLRLAFFPALIGLMPMPGGAIFSCPMVKELSSEMPVSNHYRAMVNLWFRHIWECVCPLYPGFVLACLLVDVSPLAMFLAAVPLLPCSIGIGWFFLLRQLPATQNSPQPLSIRITRSQAMREMIPLLAGILLAFILNAILPILPGYAFFLGFLIAVLICARQNKLPAKDVTAAFFTRRSIGILRVVMAIFIFKAVLNHCDLVTDIGSFTRDNNDILLLIFIIVPILGGVFAGLQIGAVGISFPILIPLLQNAGLWDDRLDWLTLGAMMCYVGQMISPTHICFVVTAKYFETPLGNILLRMLPFAISLACAAMGIFVLKQAF